VKPSYIGPHAEQAWGPPSNFFIPMNRFFALALCLLILPFSAHAWWNEAWTVRKKITLDTQTLGLNSAVNGAPVLVRLSTGNFDFLSAGENGAAIRFVAEDDKTELAYQIERFDALNELAFIWVQVPSLAPGNKAQHIWLYYGNEQPTAAQAVPVYDAAQLATWHLNDASGLPQDSSTAGSAVSSGSVTFSANGLIAGAGRLAADGAGLQLNNASLQSATALTFSAWFKPESGDGELFNYGGLKLTLQKGIPVLDVGGTSAQASAPLSLGGWNHLAVVFSANGTSLYLNGLPAANVAGKFAPAGSLRVGAGLQGEIDEVHVANEARSANWIRVQAASQGASSPLVKFSEEETTKGGAETGYFMATMKNLTIDGWVVVVICVFMFFIAIYIMWAKTLLLIRQDRSNPRFTEAFDQLALRLRTLDGAASAHSSLLDQLSDQQAQYKDSPLHRIFQVGARELKSRFHADGSPGATVEHDGVVSPSVSERAMLAVRSSLDAQLTRERQRLDSGMVLLTIAISGGPFLGLLGTVVGVMITFAAIAAAGDVNVNAIAPGIAAALVATVAGLGVAIPALFGYNYLQTRIKSIASDMNVFVDEFVTKMAETYGD
jgi:biopolymer transport protein ExbB